MQQPPVLMLMSWHLQDRAGGFGHRGAETDGDQLFVVAAEANRGVERCDFKGQLAGEPAQSQVVLRALGDPSGEQRVPLLGHDVDAHALEQLAGGGALLLAAKDQCG